MWSLITSLELDSACISSWISSLGSADKAGIGVCFHCDWQWVHESMTAEMWSEEEMECRLSAPTGCGGLSMKKVVMCYMRLSLEDFIQMSRIGEFRKRLQFLFAFLGKNHISACLKINCSSCQLVQPTFLYNIFGFYVQFLPMQVTFTYWREIVVVSSNLLLTKTLITNDNMDKEEEDIAHKTLTSAMVADSSELTQRKLPEEEEGGNTEISQTPMPVMQVQPPASNKLNEKDEKRELLLESIRKAMEGLTIVGTAMMVFL
ncbi:hypothetical protein D0Y65_004642 [Glycine soja]|nr:hypothetical protein D0Y65_004642 [Glycine soja]